MGLGQRFLKLSILSELHLGQTSGKIDKIDATVFQFFLSCIAEVRRLMREARQHFQFFLSCIKVDESASSTFLNTFHLSILSELHQLAIERSYKEVENLAFNSF